MGCNIKPIYPMKLSTIARVLQKQSPEVYQAAVKLCEPCITDPSIIPAIHHAIKSTYPDLDRTDESILFSACVYQAYSPASLISSRIERAPNGIRKEMCKIMEWKDAPTCNYYTDMARSYIKGPKFRDRVANVLSGFIDKEVA